MMRSLKSVLWRLEVLALVGATVFAFAGAAHAASVSSGFVWFGDSATPQGCRGMYLNSTQIQDVSTPRSDGEAEARVCVPGGAPSSLSAGWISVAVDAYRNGGWCGGSGWIDSQSVTARVGRRSTICSNPSGSQTFYTDTSGRLWTGNGYDTYITQHSPNMVF